ncbi:MAG: PHB depolymerase family esterase [Pseudomonadota bacterium]
MKKLATSISLATTALLSLLAVQAHAACADVEGACTVPMGEYHIALPGDASEGIPALVMLHGAGGRGEGMVNLLRAEARESGWAVIGPQGLRPPVGRFSSGWSFRPGARALRDEAAFVLQVLNDAQEKFGIDRDRVVIGGFSIGGSMASYLACSNPELARAFTPLAGNFWRPHPVPADCAGPVDMLHTHGWNDGTVPFEGRVFRGGEVRQGDVFAAMEIWREVNGCNLSAPDIRTNEDPFWTRVWTSCEAGSLTFSMHPGGHAIPRGWFSMVTDWFDEL